MGINFPVVITKFDEILSRGLCSGIGEQNAQMCIEAAVCAALDLPHGDDPQCVASSVRSFKIALNDSKWSSPTARAKGLRDLGIAQIGSKGVVDNKAFAVRLAELTTQVVIPALFRSYANVTSAMTEAANHCEKNPCPETAAEAARAAEAAVPSSDRFLRLSASLALQTLIELKSPGAEWVAPDAVARLRTDSDNDMA